MVQGTLYIYYIYCLFSWQMPLRGRRGGRRGRGGVARGCGRLTHEDAVRAQQLREARLRSTEVDWALFDSPNRGRPDEDRTCAPNRSFKSERWQK